MTTVDSQRVQRVPADWPVVHLEAEPPPPCDLVVDGLVRHPRRLAFSGLAALGLETRAMPVHCVWGWSRPDAVWEGIGLDVVLDLVQPDGDFVVVGSASGTYSACLPIADAAAGFLAWTRDGEALTGEAGGPVRFLPPPVYWAYKGVKWVARLTVVDRFTAGFWESKVADPVGLIPPDVVLP
ncbi:MAG TPA: molybdopterin-dependent oxidoreductase [Acidimicrobiales bacterium]|nr:molybdopterin-dependent oxidoreductase [Acidimicrobiales bacterium]